MGYNYHMGLLDELNRKKNKLANNINKKRALANDPKAEHLCVCRVGGTYSWRYTDAETKKRIYIPRKDRKKAEELALKTFKRYQAEHDVKLYDGICAFMAIYGEDTLSPDEYLEANPGLLELVGSHISTLSQKYKKWENDNFPSNAPFQEKRIYKTMRGELVRSKSEMIIADCLYRNNVPYRYEWTQDYKGRQYTADFTLVCTAEGKYKIWEHAGLLDDHEYVDRLAVRLSDYAAAGLRIGQDVIITSETLENPLDSAYVQYIIDLYFH